MSNSPQSKINYTPKMTSYQAYDLLGLKVRKALQEAVTEWDAYWCLRMVRKHGADKVVEVIRKGDVEHCKKGFVPARGRRPCCRP